MGHRHACLVPRPQLAGSCSGRSSLQMADTALKAGCAVLTIIWNMTCRGWA